MTVFPVACAIELHLCSGCSYQITCVRRVDYRLSIVMKVGVEPFQIDSHRRRDPVVHSKVEAVARTVVLVGAHILATDISDVFAIRQRSEGLTGLQIVNAAVGPVPAPPHQKADFLTRPPAAPEGPVEPAPPVAIL